MNKFSKFIRCPKTKEINICTYLYDNYQMKRFITTVILIKDYILNHS